MPPSDRTTPSTARLLPWPVAAVLFLGGVAAVGMLLWCVLVGTVPVTYLGFVFITAWVLVLVGYLWRAPAGRVVLWVSLGVALGAALVWVGLVVLLSVVGFS